MRTRQFVASALPLAVAICLVHRLLDSTPPLDDMQLGYIGPGAGIALLGSFFAVLSGVVSSLLFIATYPVRLVWKSVRSGRALGRARVRRVVILGLDGLDPDLADRLLAQGRLPNLARLRARGAYTRLGTTCPPLSPVAWSSFTTGTNPGKHNIFDFISRNPADYRPIQSSVEIRGPRRTLRLGRWRLPLSRPLIRGLRRSKPFWSLLGEAGIFSAVIRVPISFPPDRFRGVQLSAMCVPDLRGTHGMFSYFTEAEGSGHTTDGEVGGDVVRVERRNGVIHAALRGPPNTLSVDGGDLELPFSVARRGRGTVVLSIGGQQIALEPHRFSEWVRVSFRTIGVVRVHGLCRFLLKQFEPPFEMYCTPIQIDPSRPVMPISHPRNYAKYLACRLGSYATLGLAEDTWALSEGRLDEDSFLSQTYDIHDERERMFFDALARVRRGLVTCVFDAPDRIQHMFWGSTGGNGADATDAGAEADGGVIERMYERMDDLVGRTLDTIGEKTALFVMSDHGFKPFRRGVDLNAWLLERGYLALREGATEPSRPYLADVDWSRTRAYALGLAGIFLNVRGRERDGTVAPEDAAALRRELCSQLTGLRDPETNEVAIHEAMERGAVYSGPYVENAPDVIVGYRVGYRISWDAVIGRCGATVFSDNQKPWKGDHCVHPALVPGVLFSSCPLDGEPAEIIDLAPTTLELLGVRAPAHMDGRSLLCTAANE